MKSSISILLFILSLLISSCQSNQAPKAGGNDSTVLFVDMDSTGNLIGEGAKKKLAETVKNINDHGAKILLNAYSEQTGNDKKNKAVAFDLATAAKNYMSTLGSDKIYYSVGIEPKGYADAGNNIPDTARKNRRIEIVYLNP